MYAIIGFGLSLLALAPLYLGVAVTLWNILTIDQWTQLRMLAACLNACAPIGFGVSFLGLVKRHRPWIATIGIILGLVGWFWLILAVKEVFDYGDGPIADVLRYCGMHITPHPYEFPD